MSRISARFAALKAEGRAGLVTFVTAGDPDMARFEEVLAGLPAAGADLIEIGMPFSDPMADGPAIQAAGLRALQAGTKLTQILAALESSHAVAQAIKLAREYPQDGIVLCNLSGRGDKDVHTIAAREGVEV